jgi:hypothetical protein
VCGLKIDHWNICPLGFRGFRIVCHLGFSGGFWIVCHHFPFHHVARHQQSSSAAESLLPQSDLFARLAGYFYVSSSCDSTHAHLCEPSSPLVKPDSGDHWAVQQTSWQLDDRRHLVAISVCLFFGWFSCCR